jgi:type IV secretory pathway VirB10-like protein
VIATIMGIPDFHWTPPSGPTITLAEAADGTTMSGTQEPDGVVAVKTWFYPGDNSGIEFPVKPAAAEEATAEPTTPAPTEGEAAPLAPPQAPAVEQPPQEAAPAAAAPAETESAPATPAPPETEAPTTLPKTASSMPLVGLIGLLSLTAAGSLGLLSHRAS